MSDADAIRLLLDRAAITEHVNCYATGVDTRDWVLFRSLFAETLFLDFRSFHPSLYREMPVEELVGISRNLEAFDATQHMLANHKISVEGDRARCVAYTQAGHFLNRDGQDHVCFLYGHYTFELRREGEGWLIDRYGLEVTARHGNPDVFEWAGLAYSEEA